VHSRFVITAVLATLTPAVYGQLTRGYISGTVEDATGAVVQNVKVKIANTATDISRSTLTNEAGVYRFVALEPGIYSVIFERDGFETVRHDGI